MKPNKDKVKDKKRIKNTKIKEKDCKEVHIKASINNE